MGGEMAHTYTLRRLRQEESEASLGYLVNMMTSWVMVGDSVSRKTK